MTSLVELEEEEEEEEEEERNVREYGGEGGEEQGQEEEEEEEKEKEKEKEKEEEERLENNELDWENDNNNNNNKKYGQLKEDNGSSSNSNSNSNSNSSSSSSSKKHLNQNGYNKDNNNNNHHHTHTHHTHHHNHNNHNHNHNHNHHSHNNHNHNNNNNNTTATTATNAATTTNTTITTTTTTTALHKNKKRISPGMKASDMYNWPMEMYHKKQGLLVNQEYIQELIRKDPKNLVEILVLPQFSDGTFTDKMQWLYEHFRQFFIDISQFLVHLQEVCNDENCPKMQASNQFSYRCAAHDKPTDCSAMNYATHTVDDFIKVFQNKKFFPSRYGNNIPEQAMQQYTSCARRVYRIFAHAYHHHQMEFIEYENEHCLCSRFMTFVHMYKLIPISHLKSEAQISPDVLQPLPKKQDWIQRIGPAIGGESSSDTSQPTKSKNTSKNEKNREATGTKQ